MTNKKESILSEIYITQTKGYSNVYPKRDIWKETSEEFNGVFRISHNSGNELEKLSIKIPYKNTEINLSESDTKPLKFEIAFAYSLEYELLIYKEDLFERFLKKLGRKEIEINNKLFDEQYIIKSSHTDKTLELLTLDISEEILKIDIHSISLTINKKKMLGNLTTVVSRLINDKKTIIDLIELHKKLIDRLIEISIIK
jgi:hypothetical protein